MTDAPDTVPTDRESPVGEPVVRGDRSVTGDRAAGAVAFDPDDPEDLRRATRTVRSFAADPDGRDNVSVLRASAAAAALVRGEGSYRAAARRAGGDVSVPFVRKWARVHDLPRSIRRAVAAGRLAPSAAQHVARLDGEDRLLLAWAALDHGMTVREVRGVVSAVGDGGEIEKCLAERGIPIGSVSVDLPPGVYTELRRKSAVEDVDPDRVVTEALERYLFDS